MDLLIFPFLTFTDLTLEPGIVFDVDWGVLYKV